MVSSKKQQKQFEQTWEYFCQKYDWYNDPYTKSGIRYNLLNPQNQKQVIGTIEFVPYRPSNPESTVEKHFSFASFSEINMSEGRVWEIDKLCIHQDFQRRGFFEQFFLVIHHHATCHQPKYYIGLMEKRFFRMVRILFGFAVKQVGDELLGDSSALIPVILDIEAIMNDSSRVNQLLAMCNTSSPIRFYKLKKVLAKYF